MSKASLDVLKHRPSPFSSGPAPSAALTRHLGHSWTPGSSQDLVPGYCCRVLSPIARFGLYMLSGKLGCYKLAGHKALSQQCMGSCRYFNRCRICCMSMLLFLPNSAVLSRAKWVQLKENPFSWLVFMSSFLLDLLWRLCRQSVFTEVVGFFPF